MIQNRLSMLKKLLKGSILSYLYLYIFALISSVMEFLSIGLIFPFISIILKVETNYESLPSFAAQFIEIIQSTLNLEQICICMIIVIAGKNVAKFMVEYGNVRFGNKIRGKWMEKLFAKYINSNYSFFIRTKQGVLTSNLFTLTEQSITGLKQLVNVFMHCVSTVIALSALLIMSWQITVASILTVGAFYFSLNRILSKKAFILGSSRLKVYQEVNALPAEYYKGIREIKTYSGESQIISQYNKLVNQMIRLRIRLSFYQQLPTVFPEIILVTCLSITLIVLNKSTDINISQLFPLMITYAYAALRLFSSGMLLMRASTNFMGEKPSIKHLYREMYSKTYDETKDGVYDVQTTGNKLVFDNVHFHYLKGKTILNGVSLKFNKGQFTAIVGGSGAGKSTIADLVIRLYDTKSGSILYNDVDIKEYDLVKWRDNIGLVSQDTFLFHGTIAENISFGLKPEQYTNNDIIEAAMLANAHDFILETEMGYDTIVGEKGAKLSGGQRQRIAIARALIRKPKILILDEATSALDTYSEKAVMKAIETTKKKLILIVIAHRLSTVVNADNIVVVKNGTIIEEGVHSMLIEKNSEYSRLYNNL